MSATEQENTVLSITDFPDETTSLKDQLLNKYGGEALPDITNITLYRFKKAQSGIYTNDKVRLRGYDALPSWDDIQKEYGGGKFVIYIKYIDPNTKSGQNVFTPMEEIEGEPISPASSKPAEIVPPKDDIEVLAKYKNLGLINTNQNTGGLSPEIQLIMENSKNTNAMILEMIKGLNSGAANTFQETLLTKLLTESLKKNDSFGDIKNLVEIIGMLKGNDEGGGSLGETAIRKLIDVLPDLAPMLGPMLARKKGIETPVMTLPGAGAQIPALNGSQASLTPGNNTTPPALEAPISEANPVVDALNKVLEELSFVKTKLAKMEQKEMDDLVQDVQDALDELTDGGKTEIDFLNLPENIKIEDEDMQLFNKLGELTRFAPEIERLNVLNQFLSVYPEFVVKSFCLKYGAVKDAAEWDYLKGRLDEELKKIVPPAVQQ